MAAESTISSIIPLTYESNEKRTRASASTILALLEQAEKYATGNGVPLDPNRAAMYYLEVILRDPTGLLNGAQRTECFRKIAALNEQTHRQEPYVLHALGQCYLHGFGIPIAHREVARTHFLAAHKAQPTEALFMQAMQEVYQIRKSDAEDSISGTRGYGILLGIWETLNNLHTFSITPSDTETLLKNDWQKLNSGDLKSSLEKHIGSRDYNTRDHDNEFFSVIKLINKNLTTLKKDSTIFNEIKSRLESNANLDVPLSTQEHPLAWAIQHSHIQLAVQLIEAGACLTDKQGELTYFIQAKQKKLLWVVSAMQQKIHQDICARYKESKRDLNTPLANTQMAPLLTLILMDHDALALKLIADGALLTCQTPQKANPLHFAARGNNQTILQQLLKTPCQFQQNSITNQGNTPLHCAVYGGHIEAVTLLLENYEADPCIPNNNECLPLHLAIIKGHEQICNYFLRDEHIKQSINNPTNKGNTPLHLAAKYGHSTIALHLLAQGASLSINELNSAGETPLSLAIKNKHDSLARILLLNGAQVMIQNSNAPSCSSDTQTPTLSVALDAPVFLAIREENADACVTIHEKVKELEQQLVSSTTESSSENEVLESVSNFIKRHRNYPLSLVLTVFNNQTTTSTAVTGFINTLSNAQDKEHMILSPTLPVLPSSLDANSPSVTLTCLKARITDQEDPLFSTLATSYKVNYYSYNSHYSSSAIQPFEDWVMIFQDDTSPSQIKRVKQRLFGEDISPICFDNDGNTLLHYAAAGAIRPAIITLLLTETWLSRYINHPNHYGNTPYLIAIAHDHLEMIEILKKFGLDEASAISQVNYQGDTPLHLAVSWSNSVQSVKNILDKAPSLIHAINHHHRTPLHIAAQARLSVSNIKPSTISRQLLLMGANPVAQDIEGKTCFQNSHLIILQLLQELELEHKQAKRMIFEKLKTIDSSIPTDAQNEITLRNFIDAIETHPQRPLSTLLRAFQSKNTVSEEIALFLTTLIPEEEKAYLTLKIDPEFIAIEESAPSQLTIPSAMLPLDRFQTILSYYIHEQRADFTTFLKSRSNYLVNFEEIDSAGNTLLHYAAQRMPGYRAPSIRPDALKWLLENTILMHRTHVQNHRGETPFLVAAGGEPKYKMNNMELLSQAFTTAWQSTHEYEEVPFINLHQANCDGNTPLHVALTKDGASLECCLYLIRHGAPINHQNQRGETPLHDALRNLNQLHHRDSTSANLPMPLLARTLLLNNANPDIASLQGIAAWQTTEVHTSRITSSDVNYNSQQAEQLNSQKITVKQFFDQITEEHRTANLTLYKHTKMLQARSNSSAQIAALDALSIMIEHHPHRPLSFLATVFKTTPAYQQGVQESQTQRGLSSLWDKRCDLEKLIDSFIKDEDKPLIVRSIDYKELPLQDLNESLALSAEDFEKCIALAANTSELREFIKIQFFSHKKDPASCDALGNTLLHIAAQHNLPIFDLLLDTELFLYITFPNKEQLTPFAIAAAHGHVSIMKQLYQVYKSESRYCYQTIFTLNQQKNSLFHLAAARNHQEVLLFLFSITNPNDYPVLINAKNQDGNTPLHLAIQTKNKTLVIQLLKKGADPRIENNDGLNCLPLEDSEIKKIILTKIEELNNPAKESASSTHNGPWRFFPASPASSSVPPTEIDIKAAFLTAIKHNDTTAMLSLYEATPDTEKASLLSLQDEQKNTPLHQAAKHGCTDAGAFLLRRGALINTQNEHGETPLHLAIINEHPTFLRMLLLHDADSHIMNTQEKTPWQFVESSAFFVFQQIQNDNCEKLTSIKKFKATINEKANHHKAPCKELDRYNAIMKLLEQWIELLTTEKNRYACFSTIFNQHMKEPYQALLREHSMDATADIVTFIETLKTPNYREHFPGEIPPELPSAPSYSGSTPQSSNAEHTFNML